MRTRTLLAVLGVTGLAGLGMAIVQGGHRPRAPIQENHRLRPPEAQHAATAGSGYLHSSDPQPAPSRQEPLSSPSMDTPYGSRLDGLANGEALDMPDPAAPQTLAVTPAPEVARGLAWLADATAEEVLAKGLLQHLAERMVRAYQETEYLSFRPLIMDGTKSLADEQTEWKTVGHAVVRMGRQGRIRTEVYDEDTWIWTMVGSNGPDNQTLITEWNNRNRSTTYVGDAPYEGRSVRLREGFHPCHFGMYLESWLGGYPAPKTALSPFWWAQRIVRGTYQGTDTVEGHPCHVVAWTTPNGLFLATYFIDAQSFLLRRYDTEQTELHAVGGEPVLHLRRRVYRDLALTPLPDTVFEPDSIEQERLANR